MRYYAASRPALIHWFPRTIIHSPAFFEVDNLQPTMIARQSFSITDDQLTSSVGTMTGYLTAHRPPASVHMEIDLGFVEIDRNKLPPSRRILVHVPRGLFTRAD